MPRWIALVFVSLTLSGCMTAHWTDEQRATVAAAMDRQNAVLANRAAQNAATPPLTFEMQRRAATCTTTGPYQARITTCQ